MGKFLAGWSEVSITPEKKIGLAGQFAERISEYVETPITVTALAIEADGEQIIICSCDLVNIGDNLVKAVREKIAAQDDTIDINKVIINATHTHTSFVYDRGEQYSTVKTRNILNTFLPPEKQYQAKVSAKGDDFMDAKESLEFLIERITKAILEAWANREECDMKVWFPY